MLQFAKRLLHKNITITLIITKNLAKTTHFSSHANISLETISDGFDDGQPPGTAPEVYLTRFQESGSSNSAASCPQARRFGSTRPLRRLRPVSAMGFGGGEGAGPIGGGVFHAVLRRGSYLPQSSRRGFEGPDPGEGVGFDSRVAAIGAPRHAFVHLRSWILPAGF
ncbi:UDP-glycosyltransferase 74f2 [Phtheirospermum japonicum]|uniref:UDP-glycosyltransferase 74f2 n=1 Tax=Phtheirospermum japonicum TaxID=374723 RepID=A0A830BA36_9LAMI|nr:UDP-glycosyltransferase 74f2 [Phtheirospermum japonicum]